MIHATDVQLMHILYELTPADIPTGILLSYSETMVMKTSGGKSLYIFTSTPRLLQSHIHTWYLARCAFGKLGEAIRLLEDCGRVALSVREERLSAPPADRRRPPQILPAAKAALVPVQLRHTLSNLWKYEFTLFENWYFLSIFTECQLKSPRTTF